MSASEKIESGIGKVTLPFARWVPSIFISSNQSNSEYFNVNKFEGSIPRKKKILVVAISPPPYGGQALMVQSLLDAKFEIFQLYHVRMSFSDSMESVGKFQVKKIFHMFWVVWTAMVKRFRFGIDTLYYVPGGSSSVPVIRDVFILFFLRAIYRKIIFHFHAAGVSTVVDSLPFLIKRSAKVVYNNSDLSIFLSDRNPDNQYFRSKNKIIVSNGLYDAAKTYLPFTRHQQCEVSILFVGVLQQSKGVMILLNAVHMLMSNGYKIKASIVGEFASSDFKNEVELFCSTHQLDLVVSFPGLKTDNDKWRYFASADIFCFPSYFESESFGNVVVEAMMFGLPVIATNWRGIPDIVDNEKTGILIPIQNSKALASAIQRLLLNPEMRLMLGENGREKYLEKFQLSAFTSQMEDAFKVILR